MNSPWMGKIDSIPEEFSIIQLFHILDILLRQISSSIQYYGGEESISMAERVNEGLSIRAVMTTAKLSTSNSSTSLIHSLASSPLNCTYSPILTPS